MPALLLAIAAVIATARAARAEVVAVAAASDLRQALPEVVAAFRRAHPDTDVQVSYGATGSLQAQIAGGAPFDLFLAADEAAPRRLVDEGKAVAESVTVYATGRLALWVPAGSPLAVERGLAALSDPRARRIAIANPAHAPYGRAAEEALRAAGLLDAVKDRLVVGESASQAAQFAESGNADAALLPLSTALAPALASAGRHALVPAELHRPIRHAAVVTERGRTRPAAAALLRFLVEPEGRAVLERWGLSAPRR